MAKEKCVICDKETEYDIDAHIYTRTNYIEGTGQLCRECYKRIYSKL